MKETASYFKRLLDPKDNQSAGRFAFLFQVITSNVVVWYAWVIACILKQELVQIPSGVVEIYLAANGTAFVGKGIQSFTERKYRDVECIEPTQKTNIDPYKEDI